MTTKVSRRRERQRHKLGSRCPRPRPRKIKITRTTKGERDEQSRLDILDAVHDALRTVINGNDSNRTGELRLHRGKEVADGFWRPRRRLIPHAGKPQRTTVAAGTSCPRYQKRMP